MKIAQIAPCWYTVPPARYGGIELIVSMLTDGLIERGHDVTLFAPGGSRTKGTLQSYYDAPIDASNDAFYELPHLLSAYAQACEYDIIHDHTFFGMGAALGAQIRNPPIVHTLHVPPSGPILRRIYQLTSGRIHLVPISNAQRLECPELTYEATVYNGISLNKYPVGCSKEDYLLFVGRMTAQKGPHLAIRAANALGMRLLMGFKMDTAPEKDFFNTEVKPLLTPKIELLGELDFAGKVEAFSKALCTLMPVQWPEPFGLVAIEVSGMWNPSGRMAQWRDARDYRARRHWIHSRRHGRAYRRG